MRSPSDFAAAKHRFVDALMECRDLTSLQARVGYWIAAHLNSSSGEAWPGIKTLADKARCSERRAADAVRALVAKGWFEMRSGGGRRISNRYRPNLGRAETLTLASGFTPRETMTPASGFRRETMTQTTRNHDACGQETMTLASGEPKCPLSVK